MGKILVRALRAMTTATLIGGSVFVQHVARAEQTGGRHAELQRHAGSELAMFIAKSSKPLFTW